MRPLATGRPGTRVIPVGWESEHRAPLATARTAAVALRLPGGTESWNSTTKRTETVPHDPYYTGAASVDAITAGERTVEVAGDTVHVRGYLVTIQVEALTDPAVQPQVDDLVDVTTSSDPDLTGRTLRVTDVVRGSALFERSLFCTLDN